MLIGHLGDEVKIHYFEGGNCIARFPLATNESYTNRQTRERITNTDWHNIVVKNRAAEICEKYLSKGDKIYVEGRLKNRQWQGEDGVTRHTTEVQVQDFTFLTTKKEKVAQAPRGSGMPAQQQPKKSPESTSPENPIQSDDAPSS